MLFKNAYIAVFEKGFVTHLKILEYYLRTFYSYFIKFLTLLSFLELCSYMRCIIFEDKVGIFLRFLLARIQCS